MRLIFTHILIINFAVMYLILQNLILFQILYLFIYLLNFFTYLLNFLYFSWFYFTNTMPSQRGKWKGWGLNSSRNKLENVQPYTFMRKSNTPNPGIYQLRSCARTHRHSYTLYGQKSTDTSNFRRFVEYLEKYLTISSWTSGI